MNTHVFSFPESGGGVGNILGCLAPLMKQNGLDPNMVFAMMNNGRNNSGFGDGAWFLWIIVILALFRNGFWGGNGNAASEAAGNANGCGLLANYLATGNQSALSELSATLHCDVSALQTAINSVMSSVQSVGNQVGLTGQQVINAVQMGNMNIAQQLASCCCDIRESIAAFKGDLQLQLCQQTNGLTNAINNVATGQERGFSSVAYAQAQQTCDLKNAIADSTSQILAGQRAAEMREMQNKIDSLREKNQTLQFAASQQAQNNYLINQLQPVAKPAYIVGSPYQSYGYPYAVNNGCGCGCNNGCGCGY